LDPKANVENAAITVARSPRWSWSARSLAASRWRTSSDCL